MFKKFLKIIPIVCTMNAITVHADVNLALSEKEYTDIQFYSTVQKVYIYQKNEMNFPVEILPSNWHYKLQYHQLEYQ